MNWEIGFDMYTLMCIKLMTNKNLLYKKINEIQKYKKKMKTQPMEWEKVFANDVTHKGLISKIYKQLIYLMSNNPIKK